MADAILSCRDLVKTYRDGERDVRVLSAVTLSLQPGERVAVTGRSGSGKSTLLNLLGGLDTPTRGEVWVSGRKLSDMSESERDHWRNRQLGFVFQFHHLLPEFTALEAVAMPARIAGVPRRQAETRALELLQSVGLGDRYSHLPSQLSGGERQRVAIARALANNPSCVLMDEPTGNLDPDSAEQVLDLMLAMERRETSFIVVTHDARIAARLDRQWVLKDGSLESD